MNHTHKTRGASIFFNRFQNLNNVRIGVDGCVVAIWLFGFQNPLVMKICFRLQKMHFLVVMYESNGPPKYGFMDYLLSDKIAYH